MPTQNLTIFKSWVPEWIARIVIFMIIMSCLYSFAYGSSPVVAMGFYGIEPADVQFSMVVIYGSTVAFLALDYRIVKYFAPRKYLLTAIAVNILSSLICFHYKSWPLFIVCQFFQGITCAIMSGIALQLIFPRLHSARAKIIAYSLLYGSIQISVPFYSVCSSIILYSFDFNWLFYSYNLILIVLTIVLLITMNHRARFTKKVQLYQVDWIGYIYYLNLILIEGYLLVYGRSLGWFDNSVVCSLSVLSACLLILFIFRELKLKRPLINLQIFKIKNFLVGLLLLFIFYIFKGSTGIAYNYFDVILGNDPLANIPIWIAVITGTVLSMLITSRFILMGYNLEKIIIIGMMIMAAFYGSMILHISNQGNMADFILPMLVYGIATGVLFVPIVLFTALSVPPKIAINASYIGILFRFIGFTTSLALNGEIQLYTKSATRESFRISMTDINPFLATTRENIHNYYLSSGTDYNNSNAGTTNYFNQLISKQLLARSAQDYYDLMLTGIIVVIAGLIICQLLKTVSFKLKRRKI